VLEQGPAVAHEGAANNAQTGTIARAARSRRRADCMDPFNAHPDPIASAQTHRPFGRRTNPHPSTSLNAP